MNFERLVDSLERFLTTLPALVADLDQQTLRWKPKSENWSVLEIVCHLADEEVEDFRKRVQMTLEDSSQDWPSIDPEGVADSRNYNQQNIDEVLARFVKERKASVAWLRTLESPNWNATYDHPTFRPIQAGEVMAAWVAHDHLHTRQIAKRLFELSTVDGQPFSTRYAGDW